MLKIPNMREALLRRPFSLCREDEETFDIVYKAVGPVTRAMSTLQIDQFVQVLAPLGQGFEWNGYARVIGVAGGYGIAPLLGLGTHLKAAGVAYEVFYGARSSGDLLLQDEFAAAGIELHISTEDGSAGFKGRITELMESRGVLQYAPTDRNRTLLFVCGPHGLLQAAGELAVKYGTECRVSMEEYMGCGIGVCLGCVVKMKDGHYRTSCVEGPVMDARLVDW